MPFGKPCGLRRAHVRGHENVLKRLLVHAGAFNLGLLMRMLFGIGPPRGLQGRLAALGAALSTLWNLGYDAIALIRTHTDRPTRSEQLANDLLRVVAIATCTTGC